MRCSAAAALLATLAATAAPAAAVNDRVTAAVRTAFAALLALPLDTHGEKMGAWVVDTNATSLAPEPGDPWIILVTRLTDTGQDLKLAQQLARLGATSTARQMADGAKAMQQLEGRIAKAEADAMLVVTARVDAAEVALPLVDENVDVETIVIPGATQAVRLKGHWIKARDRELDVDYEQWSPAGLLVTFGPFEPPSKVRTPGTGATRLVAKSHKPNGRPLHAITVTAEGSDDMIAKLIVESRWSAFADLIAQ